MNKQTQTVEEDYWSNEEFEDTVASTLIACFETKVKKHRGAFPSDRMNEERLQMIKNAGPYVASSSRFLLAPGDDEAPWEFDLVNDKLPLSGCLATRTDGKLAESSPDAYLSLFHIRQVKALGSGWSKQRDGVIYEMITADANPDGVNGERRYFTVTPKGQVWACNKTSQFTNRTSFGSGSNIIASNPPEWLRDTSAWASITLQSLVDKRFCWVITAQEKTAKVHLGSMQDEIKSLLYARSLPLSSTGRKRPVLHLIEAHKRRLKNGIDIDVTSYLRGVQQVEIDGTLFTINPPAILKKDLTVQSQKRYF